MANCHRGRRIIADDGKEVFIATDLANAMMKLDRKGWKDADDHGRVVSSRDRIFVER